VTLAFTVRLAPWAREAATIEAIRDAVFVAELGVSREVERDGRDGACMHVVAEDEAGRAIGCGRLAPDGSIGRLAVLPDRRGHGVGGALLERLVAQAAAIGLERVRLAARIEACRLYERHGFAREGDTWIEAGIVHVAMAREINARRTTRAPRR
jgi:predicted GNAT family N-acyltransferase